MVAAALLGCASEQSAIERALADHAAEVQSASTTRPELRLDCAPADAEVLLDGVLQGICADFQTTGLMLDDAPHQVEVRKPGFSPFFTAVQAGRARAAMRVELKPTQ
jgi:hypothetical protein